MPLPTPDRNLPDTLDTGPPGPTGGDYADEVAAEVERLWQLAANPLVNVAGSANAITAECDPPLIADITHGQPFWLVPALNNAGGGVTLDIDSRGAVDVETFDGLPLEADDLVAGEGVLMFGYVSGSPAVTTLRLATPTPRELRALATVAEPLWEQIDDSGALGTVAQVEFTFIAGRYSEILVVASDMSTSSTTALSLTLRNAGGAIVTMTTSSINSANTSTLRGSFTVGLNATTKHHLGNLKGDTSGGSFEEFDAVGSNATAPDRVRLAPVSGNIDAGRVIAYGLLATAP